LLKEGKEGEIKSRNVIISIPEEKTFSHYLEVPAEDADDHEAILHHAKDFIPIDLSRAAVDYKKLKNQKDKKNIVYDFVAVQKSIVQPIVDIFQEAGFDVVAIDVDKNSLMRACQAYKSEQATMLVEVNHVRSLISIQNKAGLSHALSLNFGEDVIIEHLKKELNIEVTSDAKALLEKIRSGKLEETEENKKAQEIFDGFMTTFSGKIQELSKVAKMEWGTEIGVIYFIELGRTCVELRNTVKKELPEALILDHFEGVQIEKSQQRFYFNAIGLALRGVSEVVHERESNLLPQNEKEELHVSYMLPILKVSFSLISIALAGLMVLTGVVTAKSYFNYLGVQKELVVSQEKVNNPYLAKAVQSNQQQEQVQEQIKAVLSDNIPASEVISKIDQYNLNGIGVVNASYQLGLDRQMNIGIRAKTSSREDTEKWVIELDSEPLFSDVNSPLSNLAGKGERFIQVDLLINQDYLSGETLKASASESLSDDVVEELPSQEVENAVEDELTKIEETPFAEEVAEEITP
ncbi:pilus assembly protein PilM, partial [Candidatus Pacearchaeota archaeon]|nr:pilus assembly protein PilM [Candidatus Pacearchaeota archaeon]